MTADYGQTQFNEAASGFEAVFALILGSYFNQSEIEFTYNLTDFRPIKCITCLISTN